MTDAYLLNPENATSAAEAALMRIEAQRLALLAQVEAEQQARAAAPRPLRVLAIALHTSLCPNTHDGATCQWHASGHADDPDLADFSEPAHAFWVACCLAAIGTAQATGWTVVMPVEEPEPEEEEP